MYYKQINEIFNINFISILFNSGDKNRCKITGYILNYCRTLNLINISYLGITYKNNL